MGIALWREFLPFPIVAGSTIDPLLIADRLCVTPFFGTLFFVWHNKNLPLEKIAALQAISTDLDRSSLALLARHYSQSWPRMRCHSQPSLALFKDVSKDPFDGTYGPLFAPFDISLTDANPTPDNVRQQIAATSNQLSPLTIALLVNGLICVYCLPFQCNQAVGAAPVPALHGKLFAFNGKLVLGQGVLVEIPAQWFNMTAQVQVSTLDNIRVRLAAHASPTLTLGPFAGGDPNTVLIRTRAAMVLPHKYVGLFLAQPNGIPPCYYFDTSILPLLEADGAAGACVALAKYCQIDHHCHRRRGVHPAGCRNITLLMQSHLLLHH
jgi:hypothetical protein